MKEKDPIKIDECTPYRIVLDQAVAEDRVEVEGHFVQLQVLALYAADILLDSLRKVMKGESLHAVNRRAIALLTHQLEIKLCDGRPASTELSKRAWQSGPAKPLLVCPKCKLHHCSTHGAVDKTRWFDCPQCATEGYFSEAKYVDDRLKFNSVVCPGCQGNKGWTICEVCNMPDIIVDPIEDQQFNHSLTDPSPPEDQ